MALVNLYMCVGSGAVLVALALDWWYVVLAPVAVVSGVCIVAMVVYMPVCLCGNERMV